MAKYVQGEMQPAYLKKVVRSCRRELGERLWVPWYKAQHIRQRLRARMFLC